MLTVFKINNWFRSPKVGQSVWFESMEYKITDTNRYKTNFMRSISEDGESVVSCLCATVDLEWLSQYDAWGVKLRYGALPPLKA